MGVAIARLNAQHLGATFLALKSLAQLVSHAPPPYFFSCMGSPQQERSPSPPLVTIISVPHLAHR
jgi:hypothetical protein